MKIERDYVLAYLRKLEEWYGGYFGTDILNLATELGVTWHGLRKRLLEWFKGDPDFSNFHYLGRHKPSITLNEFVDIKSHIASNPLEVKSHIYSDINKDREASNEKPLTKPTFYRAVKQTLITQFYINTQYPQYPWFTCKGIKLPSTYSLVDARDSLSTVFTYSNLKTYGGAGIQAIYDRWVVAKKWFSVYGLEPILFYSELLVRERQLRSLLSSIPPDRQEDIQARLIFEIQAAFLVECLDLLLEEIIHRRGRIQQSMNASRQKVENELRKRILDSMRTVIRELVKSSSLDAEKLCSISETVAEDIKARMILLRRHRDSYHLILNVIENLVNTLGDDIVFHREEGLNFYKLAVGKTTWECLDEITKRRLTRNPAITKIIGDGNEDIARFLAIDRLVEYIRHGKITFKGSYCFQEIGSRIKEIRVEEGEGSLQGGFWSN